MLPIKQDERGFSTYGEFKDFYDQQIVVKQSSHAEHYTLWIFNKGGGSLTTTDAILLDLETADQLIEAIQAWKKDIEEKHALFLKYVEDNPDTYGDEDIEDEDFPEDLRQAVLRGRAKHGN